MECVLYLCCVQALNYAQSGKYTQDNYAKKNGKECFNDPGFYLSRSENLRRGAFKWNLHTHKKKFRKTYLHKL